MDIERYIERKIEGLNVLRLSSSSYTPGAIINTRKNDLRVGHVRDIFKTEPENTWELDYLPGNILLEDSIKGETKITGKANFLGIFNLNSGVSSKYSIDYSIDEITCCEFKKSSQIELEFKLNEFEKSNRENWREIKGYTIITAGYFAKSFTLTFKRSGKVAADVDIKKDININGDVKVEWKTDGKIIISGNEKVPFGVRGFKIR